MIGLVSKIKQSCSNISTKINLVQKKIVIAKWSILKVIRSEKADNAVYVQKKLKQFDKVDVRAKIIYCVLKNYCNLKEQIKIRKLLLIKRDMAI